MGGVTLPGILDCGSTRDFISKSVVDKHPDTFAKKRHDGSLHIKTAIQAKDALRKLVTVDTISSVFGANIPVTYTTLDLPDGIEVILGMPFLHQVGGEINFENDMFKFRRTDGADKESVSLSPHEAVPLDADVYAAVASADVLGRKRSRVLRQRMLDAEKELLSDRQWREKYLRNKETLADGVSRNDALPSVRRKSHRKRGVKVVRPEDERAASFLISARKLRRLVRRKKIDVLGRLLVQAVTTGSSTPETSITERCLAVVSKDCDDASEPCPDPTSDGSTASACTENPPASQRPELITLTTAAKKGSSNGRTKHNNVPTATESDNYDTKFEDCVMKQPKAVRALLRRFFGKPFADDLPDGIPKSRGEYDLRMEFKAGADQRKSPCLPLTPQEIEELRAQLSYLLRKGWIIPCDAKRPCSILFTRKKSGALRLCCDFRTLNEVVLDEDYRLPRLDELSTALRGATHISTLDLSHGYWQIPVAEEFRKHLSIKTPLGTYAFTVSPMGFANSGCNFMRYMCSVFKDMLFAKGCGVVVFLDDIAVYARSEAEHLEILEKVIQRLADNDLYANVGKCSFLRTEVPYMGYIFSGTHVKPDPAKTEAVREWERPTSKRGVRAFLGLTGYNRQFVRMYSTIAKPLTALTKKGVPFVWTKSQDEAFLRLKKALLSEPVLALYDPDRPCVIDTDANQWATGGVIYQKQDDGLLHPVCYESRCMSDAQRRYPVHDQELLAVVTMLKKHRNMLLNGKPLTVVTDHITLRNIRTQKKIGRVQAGWLSTLAEFGRMDIIYRPGKRHTAADGLSRKWDDEREAATVDQELSYMEFFKDARVAGRIAEGAELRLPLPDVDNDIAPGLPDHDHLIPSSHMPPLTASTCTYLSADTVPMDTRLPCADDYMWDRILGDVSSSRFSPAYAAFLSARVLPDHDFVCMGEDVDVGDVEMPISGPPSPRDMNDGGIVFEGGDNAVDDPSNDDTAAPSPMEIEGEPVFAEVEIVPDSTSAIDDEDDKGDPIPIDLGTIDMKIFKKQLTDALDEDAHAKRFKILTTANPGYRIRGWFMHEGILYYVDEDSLGDPIQRVYIPFVHTLRTAVLASSHDNGESGHCDADRMYSHLRERVVWKGLHQSCVRYVRTCDTCRRHKDSTLAPAGFIMPHAVPTRPFSHMVMDFIVGLPKSNSGCTAAVLWACQLTKTCFIDPLPPPADATATLRSFRTTVYRHYGLPDELGADRGSQMCSHFFRACMDAFGTKLKLTSGYNPKAMGEIERHVRTTKTALRCFCSSNQRTWDEHTLDVEIAGNRTVTKTTGLSPFTMTKGYAPRFACDAVVPVRRMDVPAADNFIRRMKMADRIAKDAIAVNQMTSTSRVNVHRRGDVTYAPGDWVMLTTKDFSRNDKDRNPSDKLAARWCGPFQVVKKVGPLTYEINLPPTMSRIHNRFHVEKMREYYRNLPEFASRPEPAKAVDDDYDEQARVDIDRIVQKRTVRGVLQYQVHYTGGDNNDREWLRPEQIDRLEELLEVFTTAAARSATSKKRRRKNSGSSDPSFRS